MGNKQGMLHLGLENKAKIITFIIAIVALFTPYMFRYSCDSYDGIYVLMMMSLTWVHYSNASPFFIFWPYLIVNNPINTLLRFWFVFEIYRCYIRKSTARRALFIGGISELWQLSIMLFHVCHGLLYGVILIDGVPIPLLLIAGAIILKVVRTPKSIELWNEESSERTSTDDFLSG